MQQPTDQSVGHRIGVPGQYLDNAYPSFLGII